MREKQLPCTKKQPQHYGDNPTTTASCGQDSCGLRAPARYSLSSFAKEDAT